MASRAAQNNPQAPSLPPPIPPGLEAPARRRAGCSPPPASDGAMQAWTSNVEPRTAAGLRYGAVGLLEVGGGLALDVLMVREAKPGGRRRRRALFGRVANRSMVPGRYQGGTRVVPGWEGGAKCHSQYCECLCNSAVSHPHATLNPPTERHGDRPGTAVRVVYK
jgi:hypothetical protein